MLRMFKDQIWQAGYISALCTALCIYVIISYTSILFILDIPTYLNICISVVLGLLIRKALLNSYKTNLEELQATLSVEESLRITDAVQPKITIATRQKAGPDLVKFRGFSLNKLTDEERYLLHEVAPNLPQRNLRRYKDRQSFFNYLSEMSEQIGKPYR